MRYGPPTGDLYLDILTRLGDAVQYDHTEIVVCDVDRIAVRITSPDTLYRMRRSTARPQDQADAAALVSEKPGSEQLLLICCQ